MRALGLLVERVEREGTSGLGRISGSIIIIIKQLKL